MTEQQKDILSFFFFCEKEKAEEAKNVTEHTEGVVVTQVQIDGLSGFCLDQSVKPLITALSQKKIAAFSRDSKVFFRPLIENDLRSPINVLALKLLKEGGEENV